MKKSSEIESKKTPVPVVASSGSESMTSRAYARLREDIMSGELEPGLKLKVEELRKRYDVGSSPIREALSILSSDHLVERIDQRGFRVARVSVERFEELLKTRCWLEDRALRESIANGTTEWEEQVVLAAYRLSRVPRSPDGDESHVDEEWEKRHRHFHVTLISGCGSEILVKICAQLYDQNIRYRHLSGVTAFPKRDVSDEHQAIADAVLERDANKAAELLTEHYMLTGIRLKDALKHLG